MSHNLPDKNKGSAIDPVCGMSVNPDSGFGPFDYQGQSYRFCSNHCLERFRKDPESFLKKDRNATVREGVETTSPRQSRQEIAPSLTVGSQHRAEYTCPMHPEIVRDRPGSCPICGMALEPRTVTLTDEENPELVDMTRRFWVSVVLSLPVFLMGMSDFLPGRPMERII